MNRFPSHFPKSNSLSPTNQRNYWTSHQRGRQKQWELYPYSNRLINSYKHKKTTKMPIILPFTRKPLLPAKLGAISCWLATYPDTVAPLENVPIHRMVMAAALLHPTYPTMASITAGTHKPAGHITIHVRMHTLGHISRCINQVIMTHFHKDTYNMKQISTYIGQNTYQDTFTKIHTKTHLEYLC